MKRIKRNALAMLVLGVFIVPVLLQAQMWSGRMGDQMAEEFELTEEQQTQLEEAYNDHAKEMIQLRADLQVARMDLQDMLQSGESQASLNKQVRAVSDAQAAILEATVAHQVQVREILGVEVFQELVESHRGGWDLSTPLFQNWQRRSAQRSFRGR